MPFNQCSSVFYGGYLLRLEGACRATTLCASTSVRSLSHGILGTVFLVCKPTTRLEPRALNSGSSELCNRLADWLKESETANQKACLTWPVGACLAPDFRFVGKKDMMAHVCIIHKLLGDGNDDTSPRAGPRPDSARSPGGSPARLGPLPGRVPSPDGTLALPGPILETSALGPEATCIKFMSSLFSSNA